MIDEYNSDFWNEPTLVQFTFQIKIRRYRYYVSSKEKEDLEKRKRLLVEREKREVEDEIIDRYKGEKIYKKKAKKMHSLLKKLERGREKE